MALSYGVVPGGMTSGMTDAMFLSVQDRRELLGRQLELGNQCCSESCPRHTTSPTAHHR
jgi:hypothetical protein